MPGLRASQSAGLPMATRSIVPFIPVMTSLILQALAPLDTSRRDGRTYVKEMIKTKKQNYKQKKTKKGPPLGGTIYCRRFNSAGPHLSVYLLTLSHGLGLGSGIKETSSKDMLKNTRVQQRQTTDRKCLLVNFAGMYPYMPSPPSLLSTFVSSPHFPRYLSTTLSLSMRGSNTCQRYFLYVFLFLFI